MKQNQRGGVNKEIDRNTDHGKQMKSSDKISKTENETVNISRPIKGEKGK